MDCALLFAPGLESTFLSANDVYGAIRIIDRQDTTVQHLAPQESFFDVRTDRDWNLDSLAKPAHLQ
jgi:hypothetical protein